MQIINGKDISQKIYESLVVRIDKLKQKSIVAGLAVILVGSRPDSQTYVRMKRQKCESLGIHSVQYTFDTDVTQEQLISTIQELNVDSKIHGILIQLPLPKHINESAVLNHVSLDKDVDGFHMDNISLLTLNQNPKFVPCTPDGCMYLVKQFIPDITGKNAVVVGRSRIVGLPMALMLLHNNATVTICHSKTKDLPDIIRNADILIAACGQPKMIKSNWIKDDAVVIDVGINSIADPTSEKGYKLVGDVDSDGIDKINCAITPVQGGVGPMTIAMLMEHCVTSAEKLS
jgi:5,10-methylene-tetrahydrofolate dehydrogenase/methenyl tetrahydrofolate cyclohydrolase